MRALVPIIFSALLVACSTTQPVITTARVEAVVKLGVYIGAKELPRDACQRALVGLQVMEVANVRDMAAVAAALEQAGIAWVSTPEGTLTFGVLSTVFADAWGPDVVLGNAWATAVMRGAIGGLELALAVPTSSAARGDPLPRLEAAAAATRPR